MTLTVKTVCFGFVLQGHYLLSAACSELLSRHRRAWIIDSMKLEEEHPGPFPYELGKVRITWSQEN